MVLLGLRGGVVAIFGLSYGGCAIRARRAAQESPAMSAAAIAISVFPVLGALQLLPSLGCYVGGVGGG